MADATSPSSASSHRLRLVRDQDIDPTHSATRPTIASTVYGAHLGLGQSDAAGTAYESDLVVQAVSSGMTTSRSTTRGMCYNRNAPQAACTLV